MWFWGLLVFIVVMQAQVQSETAKELLEARKVPLHEKVARRFWIRRCPLCGAKAGQDCTHPGGGPGGEAVQREHGHDWCPPTS
ncbi:MULTISPECIES: hypothetical protein [Streptomyces]|uniref:hypothetical protein n=1 Tax=Streptomyces lycopersici TaxID=2974589 RepID=UPI0021CFDD3E|nr:hypothetical protein [Streptomyces sp. NEAU-383]